jgi:Family of unknown function (DUF6111)
LGCNGRNHPNLAPEIVYGMIRIVIENVFFFLLPSLLYLAYIAFIRNDWPGLGPVVREAPLVKLFVLGAALMLAALLAFSSKSGHDPREPYTPPSYTDGKLNSGNGGDKRK